MVLVEEQRDKRLALIATLQNEKQLGAPKDRWGQDLPWDMIPDKLS